MSQKPSPGKKWLFRAVKLLIVILVVWAVRRTLYDAWQQLDEYSWDLRWGWLAVAGLVYLTGLLPAGIFWHRVLLLLGQDARFGETLRAYFIGHLGKYVPGKAMVVIIRAGLVKSHRVDTGVAAASVFFETLTMMAVGAFIAAGILAARFHDQWFLMGLAIALMIAAGLPTIPPIFRQLARLAGVGKSDPAIAEKLKRLGFKTLIMGWFTMAVSWTLLGLSLLATLRAMGISGIGILEDLSYCVAGVSLAMVAGFLSLIPGGIGVRDVLLAQLLIPYFNQATGPALAPVAAVVSAALLRLVWLVSELLISGILYFMGASRTDAPASNG